MSIEAQINEALRRCQMATPEKRNEAYSALAAIASSHPDGERLLKTALKQPEKPQERVSAPEPYDHPSLPKELVEVRRHPKPRVSGSLGTENNRPSFPRADCWSQWMRED